MDGEGDQSLVPPALLQSIENPFGRSDSEDAHKFGLADNMEPKKVHISERRATTPTPTRRARAPPLRKAAPGPQPRAAKQPLSPCTTMNPCSGLPSAENESLLRGAESSYWQCLQRRTHVRGVRF